MFLENLFSKHLTDENFETLFKFDHRWKYLENYLASLDTPDRVMLKKSLIRFFETIHKGSCNEYLMLETFQWAFEVFKDAVSMKCFAEKCLIGALCNTSQREYLEEIVSLVKLRVGKEEFLKILKNAETFFDWNVEGRYFVHNSVSLPRIFSFGFNTNEAETFKLNKNFFKDEIVVHISETSKRS